MPYHPTCWACLLLGAIATTFPAYAQDVPAPADKPAATPGIRVITRQVGPEKIRVRIEANGKLEIEHTTIVNGQPQTKTYAAKDLDTLKQDHPEGHKLYKAATDPVERPRMLPQFEPAFGPRTGSFRTIRATLRDRYVEIREANREITIRIQPRQPADAPVEEHRAKSLGELREASPQAAELYLRLAAQH